MSTSELPAFAGVQRPQRADARRNFDALIAAAREAFAENGPDASLEGIAQAAGVGIATLYRNFPTRDDLIQAVYVAEVEKLVDAAEEASHQEPWTALESWLDHFIEYIGTKRALIAGLNKQSTVMLNCRNAMFGAGAPLLERGQAAGVVRTDVGIEEVVRLMSGVAGVAFSDEAQRRQVLGIAIDGLRAR